MRARVVKASTKSSGVRLILYKKDEINTWKLVGFFYNVKNNSNYNDGKKLVFVRRLTNATPDELSIAL